MVTWKLDVGALVSQPVDTHCETQEQLAVFVHSQEEQGWEIGNLSEESHIVSFSVTTGHIEAHS